MIAWARAGLGAIDWRGVLRGAAGLAGRLGRWALILARWVLVLTLAVGRLARVLARAGLRLARWAPAHPRVALGAGLTVALAAAALVTFWPEPAARFDLSRTLDCLALNIYHEARGEPLEGKIAVGQVVMNRVGDPDFPAQVCAVVQQGGARTRDRCQFSWWCDGRSDRPDDLKAWADSKGLARKILGGAIADPTRGALWYHADHVSPGWDMEVVPQGKIGRHVFYVRQAR
jgi:hypothetical protein